MFLRIVFCCSTILFISLNFVCAQIREPLIIKAIKKKNSNPNYNYYTLIMFNNSDSPICVLHSIFINLFESPPQKLALFGEDKSIQQFSLDYSMRDTLFVYEGEIENFNAEVILPFHEVRFTIQLKQSTRKKQLSFEYSILSDFCYNEFRNAIFRNAADWYLKYKLKKRTINLPK